MPNCETPHLNTIKVQALDNYLGGSDADLIPAADLDMSAVPIPELEGSAYYPPQTHEELEEEINIQQRAFPELARERVIRSLAMYAGVSTEGDAARHFTVHKTLSPDTVHPAVHLNLSRRSAKIRAIPESWQDDEATRTPIIATPSDDREGFVDLWFQGHDSEHREKIHTAKVLAPVTPTPLVYETGGDIMVVNPQMICPLECSFCIHKHIDTKDFGLANFNPGETADYLVQRYGTEKWDDVRMIKFITGAFRSYDHLRTYMESFVDKIQSTTNGGFNPHSNGKQKIHLLTNLVQSTAELEEMKALGVGSLEHTIEIIDDKKRYNHMYRAHRSGKTPGKGEQTFDDMVDAAERAVEVYGPDEYGAAIVLGMDDEETTKYGMQRLFDVGVRESTGGVFVPNAYDELSLQQLSFSETMRLRRFAAELFRLPDIFAAYTDD